jgi:hypothetical protein
MQHELIHKLFSFFPSKQEAKLDRQLEIDTYQSLLIIQAERILDYIDRYGVNVVNNMLQDSKEIESLMRELKRNEIRLSPEYRVKAVDKTLKVVRSESL